MFGQRVPDSTVFREGVGQAILDKIKSQASSGKDRKGKPFRGRAATYSKEYAKSLEFKSAGKSKGSVNMRLSGDMLELMDIIDQGRNFIIIGFPDRDDQLKAHGHILGSNPGPKVKRDFFGLPDVTYEKISKDFSIPSSEPTNREVGLLGTLTTLRELFSG